MLNRQERKSETDSVVDHTHYDHRNNVQSEIERERAEIRRKWKEREEEREKEKARLETHEIAQSNDPYQLLSHADHLDRILVQ